MSFFKYEHPPHASRHLPPRARHACRSRPGSPRQRRPRRRPPCGRVATRASAPREARGPPRVASPRPRRVCRWRARAGSGRARTPSRPPPPRASRGARADATWHRARRLSPGGRTGSATRTAGPSTARRCRRRRRRRGSVSPDSSRCAPRLRGGALAQHVFTWPGLAAVAPAAAFATGNLGVATNAFPAVIVSALTKTAALVASAASQTVSLAAAVAAGAASGAAGYAAAAEAAAAEMAAPCAPSSPSCASPSRTPRRRRNARPPTVRAAAPRRRRRSTRFPATRRRVVRRFFSTRRASRAPSRAKTRSTRDPRVSARTWTSRTAPNATFRRVRRLRRNARTRTGRTGRKRRRRIWFRRSARARRPTPKKRKKRSKSSLRSVWSSKRCARTRARGARVVSPPPKGLTGTRARARTRCGHPRRPRGRPPT